MSSATREKLISAGLDLFSRYGIGQVGLDRVLKEAGLTKTTFYNHFASKDELIQEVISRHANDLCQRLEQRIRVNTDVKDKLLAVFDCLGELNSDGTPVFLLIINALVEYPAVQDPIHNAAVRCKQAIAAELRVYAPRLASSPPEITINRLMMILDGALIRYQVTRSPAMFQEGRQLAKLVLDNAAQDQP